ncbi:hypothetical protein L2E82_38914 [Cichorium intybus]|uniref:Uncharacterized protein n=1 Tax=Cichorium intybus TaxID=13427 RepID=A0ACB9AHN8_CICIN|nr:hypothetical protein L2E82_38914 [Cichorium intybus]
MAAQSTSSTSPTSPPAAIQPSPWHSPVPYLFGGLAAMLGLIAFALMILACSYWKLSGDFENNDDVDRDLESGNADGDSKPEIYKVPPVFEEKYLVIMAGQEKPTFLATPISSRATSFGSSSCRSNSTENSSTLELETMEEKEKQGRSEQVQVSTTVENHESSDQVS